MSMEENVSNSKNTISNFARNHVHDIIAAIVIFVIIIASLGVLGPNENWDQAYSLIMEWLPYLLANLILKSDMYAKGVYIAKATPGFKSVATEFSTIVSKLTDVEIASLGSFCDYYNDEELKRLRTEILKRQGIPYSRLYDGDVENKVKPLVNCTNKELKNEFTKDQIKAIKAAIKCEIKGIDPTLLLGNEATSDRTDIGKNERQLYKSERRHTILTSLVSSIILALIGVRDITEWGWAGLLVVLFKTGYTFASSYISYFQAYDNITINYANHIVRKCDILKEFRAWRIISSNDKTN